MSGNHNVTKTIDYVHEKIESCIQKYMSLEETITNLHENHQIHRPITTAIWKKLQSESPNFFKEYFKRCELGRQIAKFNDLLSKQRDLMHKFEQIDLSTTAPATELQKADNDDDHQDEFDEWFRCNEFADLEETVSCIIDSSPFAATRQSDPLTSFFATPQSDVRTIGLDELDSCVQYCIEETDEQHLVDKQQVYFPQEHESTTLILQEASNNLHFGDGPTNSNVSALTNDFSRENNYIRE